MEFTLYNDVTTQKGKPITWIEKGKYPVIRLFDKTRVLINLSHTTDLRQLTLVSLAKGQLSR